MKLRRHHGPSRWGETQDFALLGRWSKKWRRRRPGWGEVRHNCKFLGTIRTWPQYFCFKGGVARVVLPLIFPSHPCLRLPLERNRLEYRDEIWHQKTRIVGLPDGEEIMTQYRRVTDRRTDTLLSRRAGKKCHSWSGQLEYWPDTTIV